MDAIVIRELRVEARIGIHRREHHVKQTVSIDLDIGVPGIAVFASDKVADTIDYEQVALRIRELAASGHFRLAETERAGHGEPRLFDRAHKFATLRLAECGGLPIRG